MTENDSGYSEQETQVVRRESSKFLQNLSFPYQPVEPDGTEIRLLTVLPGDWQNEIYCWLRTVSTTSVLRPSYKTLSYAWGDKQQLKRIFLDGHDFYVTVNLWNALRRLRLHDQELDIWIDAICINQLDDVEKSLYVNRMDRIYSDCEEAMLFLGESKTLQKGNTFPVAQRAFNFLDFFSAGKHLIKLPCYKLTEEGLLTTSNDFESDFKAVGRLAKQRWWSRIWTVQEAVLPKHATLVWASERYPLDSFIYALESWAKHALGCCGQRRWTLRSAGDTMITLHSKALALIMMRKAKYSKTPFGLGYARSVCLQHLASDQRDLYYALLGLVKDWGAAGPLLPDYTKPTRSVIIEASFKSLSQSVFSFAGRRMADRVHRIPDLPTWIPDWAAPAQARNLKAYFGICEPLFNASGRFSGEIRLWKHFGLVTKALRLDSIKHVGPPAYFGRGLGPVLRQWMSILSIPDLPEQNEPGSRVDAFWRTAAHGICRTEPQWRRLEPHDFDEFSRCLRALTTPSTGPSELNIFGTLKSMNWGCNRRTLVVTESDILGNAYPEAEIGDEAYILLGHNLPCLLRRDKDVLLEDKNRSVPSFQVIGNCYIHGFMDGEALTGNWEERVETIVLV